jgi:hypothetical protein
LIVVGVYVVLLRALHLHLTTKAGVPAHRRGDRGVVVRPLSGGDVSLWVRAHIRRVVYVPASDDRVLGGSGGGRGVELLHLHLRFPQSSPDEAHVGIIIPHTGTPVPLPREGWVSGEGFFTFSRNKLL